MGGAAMSKRTLHVRETHGIEYMQERLGFFESLKQACRGKDPPTDAERDDDEGDSAHGRLLAKDGQQSTDVKVSPLSELYENVVMSGGGTKGYAFAGALKALEDYGILTKIRRVAGSSAGAICAGLLGVGCSPQEIANVFKGDIKKLFHDQTCICCCGLPNIYKRFGINTADRFNRIYGEHIAAKVGNPDITFEELYKTYGREVCIVVTNLTLMRSEYCHFKTTPDLPIRKAVRMSMSFPVIFEPVWCEINGTRGLYADGGVLDQYPIHCFDGPDLELNHNSDMRKDPFNERSVINEKTLGLYVVSERFSDHKIWMQLFGETIPTKPTYIPNTKLARLRLNDELSRRKAMQKQRNIHKDEIKSDVRQLKMDCWVQQIHYESMRHNSIARFSQYIAATLETLLVSQRQTRVRSEDVHRTIAINCGYIGTSDYIIEPGDREFMLQQGYIHTANFLEAYAKKVQTAGTHILPTQRSEVHTNPLTVVHQQPSRSSIETEV